LLGDSAQQTHGRQRSVRRGKLSESLRYVAERAIRATGVERTA
jgi:hypothetical protein